MLHSLLRFHGRTFDQLVNADYIASTSAAIVGEVQLIPTYIPYNIRRNANAPHSLYDSFRGSEMDSLAEVVAERLRSGGRADIFCSIQHLEKLKFILNDYTHDQHGGTGIDPVFLVKNGPYIFSNTPCRSHFTPAQPCNLQNATEFARHVKKNGLNLAEEKKMANYRIFNHDHSTYPEHRNIVDNIVPLTFSEQVRVMNEVPTEIEAGVMMTKMVSWAFFETRKNPSLFCLILLSTFRFAATSLLSDFRSLAYSSD